MGWGSEIMVDMRTTIKQPRPGGSETPARSSSIKMKPGGWERLPHAVCLCSILRCLSRVALTGLFEIRIRLHSVQVTYPVLGRLCDLRREGKKEKEMS